MSRDAEALLQAKTPDGAQRFYPPGEHPAAAKWQEQLRRLEEFRERFLDTPELLAAIGHCELQLARFEAGEEKAKRAALLRESVQGKGES